MQDDSLREPLWVTRSSAETQGSPGWRVKAVVGKRVVGKRVVGKGVVGEDLVGKGVVGERIAPKGRQAIVWGMRLSGGIVRSFSGVECLL